MKESWMNIVISKSLCIQFSNFKILDVLLFEFFQPPEESCLVCSYHIMSYSLEFSVWFYLWMFQKISINGCNLVRLTDLNWYLVEITNNSFHSISSINHCKMRLWISFLLHCSKKYSIVFECFLKDMFWCKDISSDSILSYEYSPLSEKAFLSEECCIKDEDRGGVGWKVGIKANSPPFLDENTSSNFLWIVRTE